MLITTAEPILKKASARLNEKTVVTDSNRLSFFNQAADHVVGYSKWDWAKKEATITLTLNQTTVDLEAEISDYNSMWGLSDEESDYDDSIKISLSRDNKTLSILQDVAAGTELKVWYYQSHVDVTSATATLNIPFPKEMTTALVLYIKHLVHDGKRQRNDARNAILDYQEVMEELVVQGASKKSSSKPKQIQHPLSGYRRTYARH
jgi:hypothetical protein